MQINLYLLRSILVGALGGLLFGFDTAVVAGTTHQLTDVFHLGAPGLGFTISIALWGTVIGAITAGPFGQKIGGREALRIMALLYFVSALGCSLSWNWHVLLAFRFIGGIGIGGSSVLGPVYLAELAPAKLRGRLVGLFQINIVVGILLAYASNYALAQWLPLDGRWRWQLGVAALPSLLFLILLFTIPRSPRWLVTQRRNAEARQVLELMGTSDIDVALQEMIDSVHLEHQQQSEPLFQRKYRLPIFLAITIGMFNQLSGINAILYYLNDIFAFAGFSSLSADKQAVLVGAMNLLATLLGMSVIDKWGRKNLLLTGSTGTAICLAGVAAILHAQRHQQDLVWLLVGFIFFFAISQGAVIWVYISEVFPNRVRAKGQGLGSSSHWIMNAIMSGLFPWMSQRSTSLPFVFFACMMALQFVVVLFAYPETKGVSLERLQHQLGTD